MALDPGPMARLASLKSDEHVPSEIFHRLTEAPAEGERYCTLNDIARSWKVPKGRFTEWFMTSHADLYEAALKVRACDLATDALQAALDATPETVAVQKLRAEVALKIASKWDRARYGEAMRVERDVTLKADAGLLKTMGDLLELARATKPLPRLIEDAEVVNAP